MGLVHLNPTEHLVLRLHRHPVVLLIEEIPFFLMLAIPPITYLFFSSLSALPVVPTLLIAPTVLLVSLYYLFVWLFIFYHYFDFILDVWVVTDDRVVNIEQKALFIREASNLEIGKIQDVTAEVKGILPTIFGYGNVYIQTAGERERFVFRTVRQPHHVVKVISRVIEQKNQEQKQAHSSNTSAHDHQKTSQ